MSRNTVSNSDDTIDSRDIIERIEELEANIKPWVAGWNMPGYMPDSEPCAFETCADACDYVASAMRDALDSLYGDKDNLAGSDAETAAELEDAATRWDSIADDEQEHGETVGNYHYFVSKDTSATAGLDPEDAEELESLRELSEEAEGYAPDWQDGAQLIRDSYFTEAMQELCDDIGDVPKELPSYVVIDWEATARNLQADYTSVEFDGVTYWVR